MVDESMSADAFNREIDYLKLALKDCIENNKTNKNDMILLHEANSLLEKAKIDRDWISKELDKVKKRNFLLLNLTYKLFKINLFSRKQIRMKQII